MPIKVVDYSAGLVVGGFRSQFIFIILDDDFLSSVAEGGMMMSDGVVGHYASPGDSIKFRNLGWGSTYSHKRGFLGALAYRHYDIQAKQERRLYPRVS